MKTPIKVTYDIIYNSLTNEGYQLLTTRDDLLNVSGLSRTRLNIICPNGHHWSTIWSEWNRGYRCKICSHQKNKNPYINIINSFNKEGYKVIYPLISEYDLFKIKSDKIKFICPNGHEHSMKWSNWVKGRRCFHCFNKSISTPFDKIVNDFSDRGYTIKTLEENYTSAYKQKIQYSCPNGHEHSIVYHDFINGHRCPYCAGLNRNNINDIRKSFQDEGYQLITNEYVNNKQYLYFICPEGHKHKIRWDQWVRGVRCGKCRTSKPETQLLNYIKFAYPHLTVIHNDRKQIYNPSTGRGLEFDIWLPELNKAIEMDGVNIHNPLTFGYSNNDILKNQLCKEKGIPLLRITDEEWYTSEVIRTKIHKFIEDYSITPSI